MTRKTMMLCALLALGAVAVLATGCGEKAEAEMTVCEGCSAEYAKADTKIVGGKALCPACAEKMAAQPAEEMLVCTACGMKMAASEMTMVDGKPYCSHCEAPAAAVDAAKDAAAATKDAAEKVGEAAAGH